MADFSNGQTVVPAGKANVPQLVGIPATGASGYAVIKALPTNAGTVYFGTGVQGAVAQLTPATGYPLKVDDQSERIETVQGNQIYVIGAVGDGVAWFAVDP